MRNKFGNRKVTINGETFDSQKEYNRYRELLLLVKAGAIHDLFRQVRFELIPAQYETYERYSEKTGKRLTDGKQCVEKAAYYVADFVYWEGNKMIVEDVKSEATRTPEYVLKRKLMMHIHGLRIRET